MGVKVGVTLGTKVWVLVGVGVLGDLSLITRGRNN